VNSAAKLEERASGSEMSNVESTISLGDEFDDHLRNTLMEVLMDIGAAVHDHTRGVGGSQELEAVQITIGDKTLVIEAETYIGLSLKGEDALVQEIARRVSARLAGS
jgi:hypothetical protein